MPKQVLAADQVYVREEPKECHEGRADTWAASP